MNRIYHNQHGFDVEAMRDALNRAEDDLDRREQDLYTALQALKTESDHLKHAREGLQKLEAADLVAYNPTDRDHFNYIAFLQAVAMGDYDADIAHDFRDEEPPTPEGGDNCTSCGSPIDHAEPHVTCNNCA